MTCISWSSDCVLYLEDYLMYNIILWDYWSYDLTFDFEVNVGLSDLFFMVQ